jgi:DNA-binding response OmpR family regulator
MARVLVIDDEQQIRRMIKIALEQEGYDVTLAEDGNAGLAAIRDQPMDLVITDLIMPDKEGIETIIELRKKYPAVPIIAISGGGRVSPKNYLDVARSIGASRVFEKPVALRDLTTAVRDLLARS